MRLGDSRMGPVRSLIAKNFRNALSMTSFINHPSHNAFPIRRRMCHPQTASRVRDGQTVVQPPILYIKQRPKGHNQLRMSAHYLDPTFCAPRSRTARNASRAKAAGHSSGAVPRHFALQKPQLRSSHPPGAAWWHEYSGCQFRGRV